MEHKKVKLSALLLLGLGLTGIQAQSMYVKEHSGIQTPYTLSSIRKLTFPTGNMTVNKTDGSMSNFALSDIRYLNFSDLTNNVSQIGIHESSNIMFYPNPVIDQLQINYESIKAGNVRVEIIDVQGRILYQKTIISQSGTNHALIPVSQLSNGIYVCRLQSDNKIEIIKFLK